MTCNTAQVCVYVVPIPVSSEIPPRPAPLLGPLPTAVTSVVWSGDGGLTDCAGGNGQWVLNTYVGLMLPVGEGVEVGVGVGDFIRMADSFALELSFNYTDRCQSAYISASLLPTSSGDIFKKKKSRTFRCSLTSHVGRKTNLGR